MSEVGFLFGLAWIVIWPCVAIGLLIRRRKLQKLVQEAQETLEAQQQEMQRTLELKQQIVDRHTEIAAEKEKEAERLAQKVASLAPYQKIADVDAAIAASKAAFLSQRDAAVAELKAWKRENEAKLMLEREEIQSERAQVIQTAKQAGERIVSRARQEAEELEAQVQKLTAREAQLQSALAAIRNAIHGYDDSYLVPAGSLLDELAEQYDFREAGQQLKAARAATRNLIKTQAAATCEYVQQDRQETAIRFVLDAFNGKVDSILAKVKHDNYGVLRQQIEDAYAIVNANGSAFRNARILPEYLVARLDELKWAVIVHEMQKRDREEQRRIQQQIREEEKARREYEKAMKDAAREEKKLAEAIAKVQAEMLAASAEQRAKYEAKLLEMEAKLKEAEEKNQKALSMAQQTKSGHVYVISNIGSFGNDVYKIGMTRRLDPLDRVRELSGASVPFTFDVHAMIYSENAPALEHSLHLLFGENQVNRVNPRKEFFRVPLASIRAAVEGMGLATQWTMRAEAAEYRESQAMLERGQKAAAPVEDDEDVEELDAIAA